jgi:hypothetical protein
MNAVADSPGSFEDHAWGTRLSPTPIVVDYDSEIMALTLVVATVDLQQIPRLYSAVETGSVFGLLHPAGRGKLSEVVGFGQIAGRNAASERPWET